MVGVRRSAEVDLGKDLHNVSALCGDDSDVVAGPQTTASAKLKNGAVVALPIVLIRPGEGCEISQLAFTEPVIGAKRFMFLNRVDAGHQDDSLPLSPE